MISIPSYSQESEYHHKFKVSLNVSANNIIKPQVYSLLARKFRSIDDVKIVDYKDSYLALNVIVLKITSKGGSNYGYAASITLNNKVKADLFIFEISMARSTSPNNYKEIKKNIKSSTLGKIIAKLTDKTVVNMYHNLMIDSDLKSLTSRIVSDIDYKVFEDLRKSLNDIFQ